MKKTVLFILIIFLTKSLIAQQWAEDLRRDARSKLETAPDDKTRFELTSKIFVSYIWSYPDSAAPFAQQAMLLARKIKSDVVLTNAYGQYVTLAFITGNYPQALQYALETLKAAERTKDFRLIARANNGLSGIYTAQNDHERAIFYALKSKAIFEERFDPSLVPIKNPDTLKSYLYCINALSITYEKANRLDSALKYIQFVEKGEKVFRESWAFVPFTFGNIYSKMNDHSKAVSYYRRGIDTATKYDSKKDLMENCYGIARAFAMMNQLDSGIFYANKALEISNTTRSLMIKKDASGLLGNMYKKTHHIDSVAKYFELALSAKDSLFNQDKVVQMQNLTFDEQLRQQGIEDEKQALKKRITTYILIAGLLVSLIIILILNRNRRQKQKAKAKIEKAYEELKSTQAQLIQSEKMASLGELTAGIAHEIQNPLNFVNNFSGVSTELVDEMNTEIDNGNLKDAKQIARDLKQNLEKINHHGKRADAIVKGMLQHSRASSAVKEPTDINKLTDEYLRFSYHGLRAKDKSFNATLQTDFDETIGNINIRQQDIGRVLLNLYNNAFYAVSEKKKQQLEDYEPMVTVSTKNLHSQPGDQNKVEIRVKDNGNGIPQKVLDKIFQPFFTTKPTGQGTGLGLSLSYDIVKAHGGEIKIETKEVEGATFMIYLPTDSNV